MGGHASCGRVGRADLQLLGSGTGEGWPGDKALGGSRRVVAAPGGMPGHARNEPHGRQLRILDQPDVNDRLVGVQLRRHRRPRPIPHRLSSAQWRRQCRARSGQPHELSDPPPRTSLGHPPEMYDFRRPQLSNFGWPPTASAELPCTPLGGCHPACAGRPNWPRLSDYHPPEGFMRTLSAKDAKYGFGRLIDLARAAPVTVAKYGRPVVVVLSVEEYEVHHAPLRDAGWRG